MRTLAALTPASSASRSEEMVVRPVVLALEQAAQVDGQPGDRGLRDLAAVARPCGASVLAARCHMSVTTARSWRVSRRPELSAGAAQDLAGGARAGARRRTSPSAGTCSGPGAPRSGAMMSSSSTLAPSRHDHVGLDRLAGVRVGDADHRDLRRRPGARASTSSTSAGYTLKPDTMMRSLARSTRKRKPSSSTTATSPVRSQPSAVSARRGGLGVVPVAGEHVRAPHPDLAGVADERVLAVGVDEPDLRAPGSGTPMLPSGASTPVPRGDDRRRLGEPVALGDRRRRSGRAIGSLHLRVELGRARGGQAHRGAASPGRRAGQRGPRRPHRRRAADDGDAVVDDRLERRLRVEALDEHDRGAGDEATAPSTTLSPKMWNSGSTPSTTSSGALRPAGVGLALLEVGEQVAVGEHRRLRRAGRAAREDEHGEVVGGRGRRRGDRLARPGGRRAARRPASSPPLAGDDVLERRAARRGRGRRRRPGRPGRRSPPGRRWRPARARPPGAGSAG